MVRPSSPHSDTEALISRPAIELDSLPVARDVSAGSSSYGNIESLIIRPSSAPIPHGPGGDVSARSSFQSDREALGPHHAARLLRATRDFTDRTSFQSDRSTESLIQKPSIELESLRQKRDALRPPAPKEVIPFSTSHPPLASSMIVIPLVILPFALGVISIYRKPNNDAAGSCLPGSSEITAKVNPWALTNIVAITLPTISGLSFTAAKFIDLIWDVIIGRGGQALLLLISYRAFSKVLTNLLPTNALTCDTYAAVAFENGTFKGVWSILRDFVRGRYPRMRYTIGLYLVMIFSGLFIAIWPTLVSAATSYGAISSAMVTTPDGQDHPVSSFAACWGIVSDGSRVGLQNDFIIPADVPEVHRIRKQQADSGQNSTMGPISAAEALYSYYLNHTNQYDDYQRSGYYYIKDNISTIYPAGRTSDSKSLSIESTFNDTQDLPSPLLNIYTLLTHGDQKGFGCWYLNDSSNVQVVTDYQILHTSAGSCIPSREYQWGFSFLLLFLTSLFGAFWFCSVLALSSYERYRADVPNYNYSPHLWRAIADLGHVLAAEVGDEGHLLQTPELRRRMKSKLMTASEGEDP